MHTRASLQAQASTDGTEMGGSAPPVTQRVAAEPPALLAVALRGCTAFSLAPPLPQDPPAGLPHPTHCTHPTSVH